MVFVYKELTEAYRVKISFTLTMKTSLVIFAVAVSFAIGDAKNCEQTNREVGLRATFGSSVFTHGVDHFYDIPRNVTAAQQQGWVQENRPQGQILPSLILYCPLIPIYCGLYDDTGYVAGFQVAVPQDNFTSPFNLTYQGWLSWPHSSGDVYWAIVNYFVTEEYLNTAASKRIANRNSNSLLQLDGVWVAGYDNEIVKISTSIQETVNAGFVRTNCVLWMGTHYMFNSTTICDRRAVFPWFAFYEGGNLMGTGLLTSGQLPITAGERDWFERSTTEEFRALGLFNSQCFWDLVGDAGFSQLHTYFVDMPEYILCQDDVPFNIITN